MACRHDFLHTHLLRGILPYPVVQIWVLSSKLRALGANKASLWLYKETNVCAQDESRKQEAK